MTEETNGWERSTINKMLEMAIKEQRATRRWGIVFKLLFWGYIIVVSVMLMSSGNGVVIGKSKPFTAVIDIKGVLAPDKPASAQNIIPIMRKAFEATSAKGIILRINSPGGSPVQAQQIYSEMQRLKTKYPDKKVYAVIEETGASGAYWLACGADEIYADKTSIVGSIGVILSSFGFVDTMHKLGVERRLYTAGDNKAMLDPFSPRVPAQDAMLKKDLNEVHELFVKLVKDSRGKKLKVTPDMFSGRFWLGLDAKNLGLIDGFGDTYSVARDVIQAPELVEYNNKPSFFGQLGEKLGQSISNIGGISNLSDYKLG